MVVSLINCRLGGPLFNNKFALQNTREWIKDGQNIINFEVPQKSPMSMYRETLPVAI